MSKPLASFRSKQFAIWMLTFLTVWLAGAITVSWYGLAPSKAYLLGMAVYVLLDPLCDRLTDWYAAENTTAEPTEASG